MNEIEQIFVYAPEIELNTVSIVWRRADLLAPFLERCDPQIHLTQPRLRCIVRAVQLAYGELGSDLTHQISPIEGASDWPIVVSVVRELGYFEECGAQAGLYEVYNAHLPGPETNTMFAEYLRLLIQYAESRKVNSPVRIFTGGRGTLYLNKAKKPKHRDDFKGDAIVQGTRYQVSAEVSPDSTMINLRFSP